MVLDEEGAKQLVGCGKSRDARPNSLRRLCRLLGCYWELLIRAAATRTMQQYQRFSSCKDAHDCLDS